MFPTADPQLLEICRDVVVRFKGHGSYGGEPGALKALKRRSPCTSAEDRRETFEMFCRVYDRAVEAIGRYGVERPEDEDGSAHVRDIDFEACMRLLDEIEPGSAIEQKGQILNWVIFWHYLK